MYDVLYQGSDTLLLLDMLLSCHNHRFEIYHLLSGKMTENNDHIFMMKTFSCGFNFFCDKVYSYFLDEKLHENLVKNLNPAKFLKGDQMN